MLKLLEIGLSSPEYVKIVCKVCESVWKSVWECMKLRILNVLTETAPTIPQTPQTDLKYPYVPKMAIWTHCEEESFNLETFPLQYLWKSAPLWEGYLVGLHTVGPYGHFRDIGVF